MTFNPAIPDVPHYVAEMAKPLIDKMFFMDKVDAEVVVDYGCADGVMLAALRKLFPSNIYIGYDISEAMIEAARLANPGIVFTSDWGEVRRLCAEQSALGRRNCLVLESIIHEAYSYLNPEEIGDFWRRVWGDAEFAFDAIAIRDMMVSRTTSRLSDPIAVARVRQIQDPDKIAQWERQWGNLNENWSFVHFLLTYRYEENWAREYKENYLPVPVEDFMHTVPQRYFPTYHEHFVLPFIRRQVMSDFGIVLADPTHIKFILELRHPPV